MNPDREFTGAVEHQFTGRRPSPAQVAATWVKSGMPGEFTAYWGENGTRFTLRNNHVYDETMGFSSVCRNVDSAALLICNKAYGKPVNDFSSSSDRRFSMRP